MKPIIIILTATSLILSACQREETYYDDVQGTIKKTYEEGYGSDGDKAWKTTLGVGDGRVIVLDGKLGDEGDVITLTKKWQKSGGSYYYK